MNEERAKKVLQEQIDKYGQEYDAEGIEALKMAIKALERTRWIPVSERLPEDLEDVLVYDGVDMFVAWYDKRKLDWRSTDANYDRTTSIVAWQPLPQPYKAESEG